jgi:hypothetical protein
LKEHRLPSLCAQRSFTPLLPSLKGRRGESPLGAQATGLCSARPQSTRPYSATARWLEPLHLLVSDFAPNNVFVVSTVDKRGDFPVLIVTKQDSAFDAFAKEKLRCFRK